MDLKGIALCEAPLDTSNPSLSAQVCYIKKMKRPWFLSVWLGLLILSDIYSLFKYNFRLENIANYAHYPGYYFEVLSLINVCLLIALLLLWNWRKIGFHIYLLVTLIAYIFNGIVLNKLDLRLTLYFISVILLYLAMRPVWNKFK